MNDTAADTPTDDFRYQTATIPVLRRALLHDAARNETRAGEHYQPGDAGFQDSVQLAAWSGLLHAASSGRIVAALLGLLDDPGVPAEVRERGRHLVGQVLDGWPEAIEAANDDVDEADPEPSAARAADVGVFEQLTGAPEPIVHAPELDEHGYPTDHARCDRGEGEFNGGVLAHSSWQITCEKCLAWPDEPSASDDAESVAQVSASPEGWDDAWSREQRAEVDDPANWGDESESGAAK